MTGDNKGFVVVADVLSDLVNVVARDGGGGFSNPTNAGNRDQSFDGREPLAESTPNRKRKPYLKWPGKERECLYECFLSGYRL